MSLHDQIKIFQNWQVRTAWDDEKEVWYFSIVDTCAVLTDQTDYDKAKNYWKVLKFRMIKDGIELVTNCNQLKLVSPKDGKRYKTDVATTQELFRIIQYIPSQKAEYFRQWLEDLAKEKTLKELAANSNILIYSSEDGSLHLDVQVESDTVWLTQSQMATLFARDRTDIGKHIANIYEEGELQRSITCAKFAHVGIDGDQIYTPDYYNLDVVISVGYRVHSIQGVRFRQWATTILKEYIIKGVALDDERFKQGTSMNYFRQLLERIREIRISEKVFYQQIKDIYKTSIDYDSSDEKTLAFFKEVQNKLLWAVSEKTAAELIYYRSNAELPLMGLTSTEVPGKVLKRDITIGKNYLKEDEIQQLKLIVEQFLAYAEAQATAHRPMYMTDWISRLRMVLTMNERNILEHAGRISHQMAIDKANAEYATYTKKLLHEEHLESIKELSEDLKKIENLQK